MCFSILFSCMLIFSMMMFLSFSCVWFEDECGAFCLVMLCHNIILVMCFFLVFGVVLMVLDGAAGGV